MTATILSRKDIKAWRRSIARENGTLAVVMGSFAILQPGNLNAVNIARRQASSVCVILETATQFKNNAVKESRAGRAELVSFLRNISAVCEAESCSDEIESLRPFTMIDYPAQPGPSSLRKAARATAESIVEIEPLPGCFTEDISNAIRNNRTPINTPAKAFASAGLNIREQIAIWRQQGKTITTVNGCFDILHIGHARMLAGARSMGDELIVLVNDDASVRTYKGDGRPVFPIRFRLQALSALEPVSLACSFSGDNPLSVLSEIRPDVHVKGGTFEQERVRAESELLRTWGGRVEFRPLVEGYSTTRMIEPIRQ